MQIFLGDTITLIRGNTQVTGKVEGLRLKHGELAMIAIENIAGWLIIADGWQFVEDDEDGGIEDGEV